MKKLDISILKPYKSYKENSCYQLDGDLIVISGINGSGKSQLLKIMLELVDRARVVITHGGPCSFIMPLQIGKVPIVVPRRHDFDEHVNNHQVMFSHAVAKRQKNIIVVEHVEKFEKVLKNYEKIVGKMKSGLESNNEKFCKEFGKIVDGLVK